MCLALCLVPLLLASVGCEVIASFDRDKIPMPGFRVPDAATFPPGMVIDASLPNIDAGLDGGGDDAGPDDDDGGTDGAVGMDAKVPDDDAG